MKSNISPIYYHEREIFENEKNQIFKRNWQFMGFKNQLLNNNDFIAKTIAGTPVVVQNSRGEIRAFLNVCSHRFCKLQADGEGNRPLVCPYHGWAYDKEGIPTGIPKKPLFKDFSHEELCELRLKEFKVDFCGSLCFVSLEQNSVELKQYLGEFYTELAELSMAATAMVDVNSMVIKANWKIIVENTLESYHVASIHTNTFKKLGAQGLDFSFTSLHSNWNAELAVKRDDPSNKKIEELFKTRSYKIDGYKHILVFPNLLISSTHGSSFNFSVIDPLEVDSSLFTSYVFTAVTTSDEKKALLNAYTKSLIDFNRQVFDEDKAICQLVQKGVSQTSLQGVLSLEEERVHAFQKVYMSLINHEGIN